MKKVEAIREKVSIPTYGVGSPDRNPIYFPTRVYQGSCGDVYPIPFIDKVYDDPMDQVYDTVRIENDYLRLVLMPEIGGRIFLGQDKTNSDYDFLYRQDVIKPALVGLAGPWISGGIEFNWPQHHRPSTFMPSDLHIENESDGATTVWMSDHDPISHLKGMHGVRIRPDSSLLELRVRLFNRTPMTKTFLWWANLAARVHDRYRSFFPPDVHYVADHAARDMSSFPIAEGVYYGIDYANRPGANDLSWYKNIPVPTSYMVCETAFDFFGGYDYDAGGGFIHVANRHIAPGKKQWTWGNSEFGWAWDRELTDENGPYVELMAGVYTDNQPDFAYLLPYETKTFSQFWWPYKKLGPVQNANRNAAIRLVVGEDRRLEIGAAVSRKIEDARIVLMNNDRKLLDERIDIDPAKPWISSDCRFEGDNSTHLQIKLYDSQDNLLIGYRPIDKSGLERNRSTATEPPPPAAIESIDELYLTGEHLDQYRHPTRSPEIYWERALHLDPGDARTLTAMGRKRLDQGLFDAAGDFLAKAVKRLTRRHPNPYTGEAHYYLGLTRRFQDRLDEAYGAFYKSTWNYEWRAAAFFELANIDCRRGALETALEHLEASLDTNRQNNKARVLRAIIYRHLGEKERGIAVLHELLGIDPLDHWARFEIGLTRGGDFSVFLKKCRNNAQTILDLAYDYADAGFYSESISLLNLHHREKVPPASVPEPLARNAMTHYALAWMRKCNRDGGYAHTLHTAREESPDFFFPSRLQSQPILEWALAEHGTDRNAAFGLGNYLYARGRREEALAAWEQSIEAAPRFATALRNLGTAYWNVERDGAKARRSYETAIECDPSDARLLFEYDQLRRKLNDNPEERLRFLEERSDLVKERDDCSVELAALYNLTNQPAKVIELLKSRRFHPWEGGEGKVLQQYTAAQISLGRDALGCGDGRRALRHFRAAFETPENLGESYHPLQAKADINYWKGKALQMLGCRDEAAEYFGLSAAEKGDFQDMAVTEHSELSYYRGLSLRELGREDCAEAVFRALGNFAAKMIATPTAIDYFATSLPTLLVFEEDMEKRRNWNALYLSGLAESGLGNTGKALMLFKEVVAAHAAHRGARNHLMELDPG